MQSKRAASAVGGTRRQPASGRRKKKFSAEREAVKLLLFTQAVMYLGAGALPGVFRLMALLPIAILAGAGVFRLLSAGLALLEARNRAAHAKPAPVAHPQPAPVPAKEPVLVSSRVA
ncbi:MAG TPA: hypothetical protein VFL57_14130 [Bryobacteraceae bacterium]|nr:hypothetical protein [Bryobacteraceae bacterium]